MTTFVHIDFFLLFAIGLFGCHFDRSVRPIDFVRIVENSGGKNYFSRTVFTNVFYLCLANTGTVVGALRRAVNRSSKASRLGSTTRKPAFVCTAWMCHRVAARDHPRCRPPDNHLPVAGLFSDRQLTTRVQWCWARVTWPSQTFQYTSRLSTDWPNFTLPLVCW